MREMSQKFIVMTPNVLAQPNFIPQSYVLIMNNNPMQMQNIINPFMNFRPNNHFIMNPFTAFSFYN